MNVLMLLLIIYSILNTGYSILSFDLVVISMLKINKILSKKIKFPLSLRGLFPFCHSRESGNPSSPSLRGAKQRSNLSGFSLIELMVAVVILAMVVFGIFLAFSTGFQGMADARDRTVATNYAREAMEDIKNMDFEYISAVSLEQISGTKYKREVSVEENVEGSPNLKKITVRVIWEKRNGDNINVETSMLINKIEFLPDVASKLLLYVAPYNIILPIEGSVNLIAVVKDAKGNTVTAWDGNITFSIMGVTIDGVDDEEGEISCYLKNENIEQGSIEQGQEITVDPINGIAEMKLYTGDQSTLEADEIGNINVSAETSSAETGELSDSVNIKVTQGAVKIDLISKQDSIETNTIKIDSNTEIIAKLVDAEGDKVSAGEAEIIFNVSGEGTLIAPLTKDTENQQTSITLTASNTPGVATVTASADNLLPGTIDIYVTGLPESIYVEVNPNYIYTDQDALVTVTLKDINGITVVAENDISIDLSISPDLGEFTDDQITIFSGNSSGSTTFTPNLTGIGDGIIHAVDLAGILTTGEAAIIVADTLVADHIDVSASPSSIEAGGNTPSIITAVIKSAEPENDTVYNYSEDIIFTITSDIGCFSVFDSGYKVISLTNGVSSDDFKYQDGVAWVKLYSNFGDTSGVATITVTSGILDAVNTEVGFYVEADHIELTSSEDPIYLFGVPDDTCTITATIMDGLNIVENYVGTVLFSIISGTSYGQFTTTGSTIVSVANGEAKIDLRGQCDTGNVRVRAVTTFGETVITTAPDDDLYISVDNGDARNIALLEGSIWQPANKKGVGFDINNTGVELKIYNLKATWGSSAKITEIKIDNISVYSGSVSDGDIVDIAPTDLPYGEHEIYFTYSSGVGNNIFEIILNAEPDCLPPLLDPIIFET